MFLNANRPMVNKASILNFIVPPRVKLFRVSDRTESAHAMYLIASSRLIPVLIDDLKSLLLLVDHLLSTYVQQLNDYFASYR